MHITVLSTISWPACIVGMALCVAAVIFTFMSRRWSALLAFVGLSAIYFWGDAGLSSMQYYFWGAAALIAWGIGVLLPRPVADSRHGVGYIAGGALAGSLVGMLMSIAGMITGAVIGAFCGAFAYSRTPEGGSMIFPSSKFLHYLCAKGLPAVVTMCILCMSIATVAGLTIPG